MELVSQHAAQTRATTRPFALGALLVASVITAAVISGALVWTSPRVAQTVQAGNYLLDPALIQVREGERTTGAVVISSGNRLLDSALILLRKGERTRLDRRTTTGNHLLDPAPIHVGKGPLAGGR